MFRPLLLVALLAGFAVRAAEPHPSLPPPVIPDCLGVNIHFTDPQPGELEMLAAAGFKWVRMDFGWEATEKKKGEYDFSAYDRLVAKLDQFKIRAVFILDYGNPLYADPGDVPYFTSRAHTPEFRDAFGKWAVAAVRHFQGRGYLWDMWNEPNGGFWKSPDKTGDYIALAKSTGEALRQAGLLGPKGEAFIGPATSLIDLPYLEACFKAGLLDYWDAVSVHPYRQGAPETVEEEYRSLRLLIRKYAPKDKVIPIISGEWGYSSAWAKFDEEKQAKYLPRELLTNIANDVPLSIWYDWHEDGTDPKESEHHFGIVHNEYHAGRDPVYDPKPAYTAMKTLNEQLSGFSFNKRLGFHSGEFQLLFERGDELRLAAFYSAEPINGLCAGLGAFESVDLLGHQHRVVVSKEEHGDEVKQGAEMEYFRPIDPQPLWNVVRVWSRLPLEFVAPFPSEVEVIASGANSTSEPIQIEAGTRDNLDGCILVPPNIGPETLNSGATFRYTGKIEVPAWHASEEIRQHLFVETANHEKRGFHQLSKLVNPNPFEFLAFPSDEGELCIRVSKPIPAAYSGQLKVTVKNPKDPGHSRNIVRPLVLSVANPYVMVRFEDVTVDSLLDVSIVTPSGSPAGYINESMGGLGRLDFPLMADSVAVFADGEQKVEASAALASSAPTEGPPFEHLKSLRLSYRIAAGWKFLRVAKTSDEKGAVTGQPSGFGLWLHGDGKGLEPRVRFVDASGQTFQPDGPKIDWKGWRYITFPMRPSEENPLAHWGGANDGVIHYPIKWDSIFLLDNVSRQPVEGEIYLSAPTLIY